MSRAIPLLAACLSACLLALSSAADAPTPADNGAVLVQGDVVFGKGGDRDLHADLAWPKNATKPTPAIIRIHGGGWIGGTYHNFPIDQFARAGFFAASIEYRLSGEAKWPAQIQDCKCAVRWLRANAAKYNVDPNRIGVLGDSAGGHLVACLDTMSDPQYEGTGGWPGVSSAVQAVVDYYGPTDFTRPDKYSTDAIWLTQQLFGLPYEQDPALWKSASPLYAVKPGDAPVLMIHGASDILVPIAQSQMFAAALTTAGVPNQLLVIKNAGHSLVPDPGKQIDPGWPVIFKTVLDFYTKYLPP